MKYANKHINSGLGKVHIVAGRTYNSHTRCGTMVTMDPLGDWNIADEHEFKADPCARCKHVVLSKGGSI